ncbi:hypothetical protein RHMOL_Rhmol11G0023600 [Rhododendron molle]|uniref:Uncharacterized protein n=1 Tax=Rhododendron molle TaxID=49168 RepID=A0ACC0LNC1_RHOML|nr:hypothetical protein RHMOL_Rhmol11G0023600 [Rhododendron molle]
MAYYAYTGLLSSIDKQDNQKGSLEEKKKRKITPIKKKTFATIVERESNDMPTVCHNKDKDKLGKRTNGKKRSTISNLKQDIDEGSVKVPKRRRNTSMQEPSFTTIVEKKINQKVFPN